MPTVHLEVTGQVQGVGFRWYVRERARALGLAGWVRNLPGGEVELEAAGPDDALQALEAAVAAGPPAARVSRVIRHPSQGETDLPSPFAVLR